MNKRIPLATPHLNGHEIELISEAVASNYIAPLGPHVDRFERDLSSYIGTSYALATSSGTAAIHLALKYLKVQQDDYVLCSSLTFAGSCNPILYEKAIPIFVDSELSSWNMSPIALEKAIIWAINEGKKPKAVIVVNLYGQSADYDEIKEITSKFDIPIIEDAAESLGATYKGRASGSFGEISILSFNGNKIITTSGGGMAFSNDKSAIDKMRFWSTQSREKEIYYEHKEIGYNYRMSNISAAIGIAQFQSLADRISKKKEIYLRYQHAFKNIKAIKMMPIAEFGQPNYWLSVFTIAEDCTIRPNDVLQTLLANNIESRPVWKPMHLQPVFKMYPYFNAHSDSVSDYLFKNGLCLPSDTKMTIEEQDFVIAIIKGLFNA